jgi:hypothetical protein
LAASATIVFGDVQPRKEVEHHMPDKAKTGYSDRDRIDVSEDYELRNWSQKFGVTPEQLMDAVQKVGPMVADVAKHLGKPGYK